MIRTKPIPLSESRPLGLLGKIKSSSSVEAVCVGNGKREKKNEKKIRGSMRVLPAPPIPARTHNRKVHGTGL